MAATKLTGFTPPRSGTRSFSCEIGLSWLCAYAGVWGATLAAVGIVALVGGPLSTASRQLLGLALTPARNPPPHLVHVFVLAAHNIPIVAWPLLLGLVGADRHRVSRHVADSVVLVCTLANTMPVGAALGAYGTPLIAYIPQLPLEWAGLALGLGSWLVQRRLPISTRQRLLCLALIIAVMLAAGTLETVAAPHR
jgi:hypothetical protein